MKRALILLLATACGTLGDTTASTSDLPSAEMGPFRALKNAELKGTAPFVLADSRAEYSDPAALVDGAGVILYAVAGGAIVRTRSLDGRTFYGNGQIGKAPLVVLRADQPWEGDALSGPFAFRRGSEIFLYYAGRGGIGVARSSDGLAFTKEPGPILTEARAPSVFALPDGRSRMFYVTTAIEEAESPDGVAWARIPGTVLGPSLQAGAFDAVGVGDPCVATRTTPAGRFHVRVLYTGTNESGVTAIGFAGRFGEDGPLARNPLPAFPTGAAPAYAPPFLYVAQARSIAGAIEPLDAILTSPSAFPPSP